MTAPLALTMGDPAGIGPEITAKLFTHPDATTFRALVIGDAGRLDHTIRLLGLPLKVRPIGEPEEARFEPGVIDVLSLSDLPGDLPFGQLDARAGRAAYEYVERAIDLARTGRISGIVTAPINKEALFLAGVKYPGHTEILADQSGTDDFAMMLVSKRLRVILVTIHVALKDAVAMLSVEQELRTFRLAHDALRRLGIERPRIAVAGVNPHASENGLFGREDLDIVVPAIERGRAEGLDVSGPYPGDTVFTRALKGDFDLVVAQYHDQGLIPIKLLDFDNGVNVTVGLPFVRTSVDHGTAFDIAGQGVADESSLRAAVDLSRQLTANTSET